MFDPHLEFAMPAWSPWTEWVKKTLQKVQQRAIEMVSGLNSNGYEDRLKEQGMETLEERRHQADKCMTRNIMHIRGMLDPNTWFDKPQTTRGLRSAADPLNVKKRHGKMEIRTNFFSIRAAHQWNHVPTEAKALETTGMLKVSYKQLRRQL